MTEHGSSESRAAPRVERSMTGPVDRPMTRDEALSMRGFGWDGNLDQMRSGEVTEIGDVTDRH